MRETTQNQDRTQHKQEDTERVYVLRTESDKQNHAYIFVLPFLSEDEDGVHWEIRKNEINT